MWWFRARARHCAGLGLFAIALQLVLTFGHVHHEFAPVRSPTVSIDGARSANAGNTSAEAKAVSATVEAYGVAGAGRSSRDGGDAHDLPCSLCIAISLASVIVFASPPLLALPHSFVVAANVASVERLHLAAHRASFWSRGPPDYLSASV